MINFLVIKSVKACNLRCRYCYYINQETQNYGEVISVAIIERLYEKYAEYLRDGAQADFGWHGGEPLLLGRRRFQQFLDLQHKYFPDKAIRNRIQSNGLLIDQSWIEFFRTNNVSIGISLDGLKDSHDRNRVTKSFRGTFVETVRAIQALQRQNVDVGVLAVIDGESKGSDTIQFFKDIGISSLDLLLPITNHAIQRLGSAAPGTSIAIEKVGAFLCDAFNRWVDLDDDSYDILLFQALIQNAFGIENKYAYLGPPREALFEYIIIETNGDICLDEEYGQIDRYNFGNEYNLGLNVLDDDFTFFRVESMLEQVIEARALAKLPDACKSCGVKAMCRGSHPGTRFDDQNGSYNNASVYCSAMSDLCREILRRIRAEGLISHVRDPVLRAITENHRASHG